MTYVVHLEDDSPLREILKVAFQATDPNVNLKQFISGDEVVSHIKPNIQLIDLFVLDIRVPGSIDGLEVARKIREFGSDAPIIMTSAYRQPDRDLIENLKLEWMSKPWHIMEIAQRLVKLARDQRAKSAKSLNQPSPAVVSSPNIPTPTGPALTSTPPTPLATAPAVTPAASVPAVKSATPVVTPPAANSSVASPTIKPRLPGAPAASTPPAANPPPAKPPTTGKT